MLFYLLGIISSGYPASQLNALNATATLKVKDRFQKAPFTEYPLKLMAGEMLPRQATGFLSAERSLDAHINQ